jgi:hypothetical protein
MSFQLERVGTFIKPDTIPWRAGATFNPGFYMEPGSDEIDFTFRGTPVSGANKGEFKLGTYISSVGYGTMCFNPQTNLYSEVYVADTPWLTVDPDHPKYPHVNGMGYEDASKVGKIRTSRGEVYTLSHNEVGIGEDGKSVVRVGLATRKDLKRGEWHVHGPIGPDNSSKGLVLFQSGSTNRDESIHVGLTLDADTHESAPYLITVPNFETIINPPGFFWENFLENRELYRIEKLRPSPDAHRGAEIGGNPVLIPLGRGKTGALLPISPESFEERWDIAYVLLDADNPIEVIAESGIVLTAGTATELYGPVSKRCAFPGSPVIVDAFGNDWGGNFNQADLTLLQPHGEGDLWSSFARGDAHQLIEDMTT